MNKFRPKGRGVKLQPTLVVYLESSQASGGQLGGFPVCLCLLISGNEVGNSHKASYKRTGNPVVGSDLGPSAGSSHRA